MKVEEIIATKEINKPMSGMFIISEIALRTFVEKDGSFLTFILQDKTGRVQGKIWEGAESFKIQDDTVISITGKINLFRGKNQVIVESAKVEKEFNISDFLPAASVDANKMLEELFSIMETIQEKSIKILWQSYKENKTFIEQFKLCPAGRGDVHHAYLHGLLEHTLSAVKICDFYSKYFEDINRDILLMGAFLHDLGKIEAYKYSSVIKMSDIGRLHGHTSLSYHSFLTNAMMVQESECFGEDSDGHTSGEIKDQKLLDELEEASTLLGHMILSHHGALDKGAAVVPMTREAILLVKADGADADINHVSKILESVKDNWSQYDNLRGRMYYQKQEEEKKEEVQEEIKPKRIVRKKSSSPLFEYDKKA